MEMMKLSQRNDIRISRRANPDVMHTVIFARKQNNVEILEHILNEVSDPMNARYGRHLSKEEVNAMIANPEGRRAIEDFLRSHNIRLKPSSSDDVYIEAVAPVKRWEEILEAEFFEFSHTRDPTRVFVRSLSYSLPQHLQEHVHAVFNTVQLPTSIMDRPELVEAPETATMYGYTTPPLLNRVYNIRSNTGNNLTTQAIYGNLYQSVSPSDLSKFQAAFELPQQAITAAEGGHVTENACSSGIADCLEANLDAEYLMAVAQGVPTQYYYWSGEDVWLDWIMTVARMEQPPAVFTISYGSYEFFMSPSYLLAFNTEAIKLGVMGTTLLAASGDDGVAGFAARILGPAFCDYLPMFPASSPYVTAVGGTMVRHQSQR
jgi:tripeptidyl-peptidase-1